MNPTALLLLLLPLLLPGLTSAHYTVLQEAYTPSNFFSKFNFFTGPDPTRGFVSYLPSAPASATGLIRARPDSVYIGVDNSSATPAGRPSVRLESHSYFNRGLFLLDVSHIPSGCGTWPAFWSVGGDWPENGEIDIIEGVNGGAENNYALHTSEGCTISGAGCGGKVLTDDCNVDAVGQGKNQGCAISDSRPGTFGDGFNEAGGGVVAMEWTVDAIKMWVFMRGEVPADVLGMEPAPENWGAPEAEFRGGCDIASRFQNHRLVINTTFCGDWAGGAWADGECGSKAATCEDYVRDNPEAFAEAYWRINSLRVFSQ